MPPSEIFVPQYTPPQESVHGWFCSICDGHIHTLSHPNFSPQTTEKCPLCSNPNRVEKEIERD